MLKFISGGIAALSFVALAGSAFAQDVEFTIINNSSIDLHFFYTTPSNEDSWGEDLLADMGVLESGYEATAMIGDGSDQCLYDFKFLGPNGEELIEPEIDICTLSSYTLTD